MGDGKEVTLNLGELKELHSNAILIGAQINDSAKTKNTIDRFSQVSLFLSFDAVTNPHQSD